MTIAPIPTAIDEFLHAKPHRMTEFETVAEYLCELLVRIWRYDADPEYGMSGNSDWRYELYVVLVRLGLLTAWDENDGMTEHQQKAADEFIACAIRELTGCTPPA